MRHESGCLLVYWNVDFVSLFLISFLSARYDGIAVEFLFRFRRKDFAKHMTTTKKNAAPLKIIPLGGLDGIGKNMTVFECGSDMVLVDAG